jgi:hypothetical protein
VIVYLVFAHRRLGQLERLVRRLRGPDTTFVVHIDARSDLGPGRAHVEALARMTDVSLMPRYRTPWGGIGLVEATLAGLAQALRDHPAAEHVCVLSGQDYPIAPPERIREFFSEGRGATFMEHHPLPRAEWADGELWRIADYHWHVAGRRLRIPVSRVGRARRLPRGMRPYQGGQCWTMSRECAAAVTRLVRDDPALLRFFRHSAMPDESFFQTLVMALPAAERVINDDMRFERWEQDQPHPAVLTMDDLGDLMASDRLFAKKFDVAVDAAVLDAIDARLPGRPVDG